MNIFGPPPCPHPHLPFVCDAWHHCWQMGVWQGAVTTGLVLLAVAVVVEALRSRRR